MSTELQLPKPECKKRTENKHMAKWCMTCAPKFEWKIEKTLKEQEKYGVGWGLWEGERLRKAEWYWGAVEKHENVVKKSEEEKLRREKSKRKREEREREKREAEWAQKQKAETQEAEKQKAETEKREKAEVEKERRESDKAEKEGKERVEEEESGRKRGKSFLRFLKQ